MPKTWKVKGRKGDFGEEKTSSETIDLEEPGADPRDEILAKEGYKSYFEG